MSHGENRVPGACKMNTRADQGAKMFVQVVFEFPDALVMAGLWVLIHFLKGAHERWCEPVPVAGLPAKDAIFPFGKVMSDFIKK